MNKKISKYQLVVLVMIFVGCFSGAVLVDPEFCPDEWGRQLLTNWIYKNGKLPIGDEEEILLNSFRGNCGFFYAYRPYLSSIINAMFMRIVSIFTSSERNI